MCLKNMKNQEANAFNLLAKFLKNISKIRRWQLIALLALMILVAGLDIIGVGAVLPFIALLMDPEGVVKFNILNAIFVGEAPMDYDLIKEAAFFVFVFVVLLAGISRLALQWCVTRFSFGLGAEIGADIYRKSLYQSYKTHCARNSSDVLSVITVKANTVIYSFLIPVLNLISGLLMIFGMFAIAILMQPINFLYPFLCFGLLYLVIILLFRKRLLIDSGVISDESRVIFKNIQEGLGGIRDIIIDGTQEQYVRGFKRSDLALRHAQGNTTIIAFAPRYIFETFGILLVAVLAYIMAKNNDGLNSSLPVLAMLVVGAQRILPIMQQAYGSITSIQSSRHSLIDVLNYMEQDLPFGVDLISGKNNLDFKYEIILRDVEFCYDLNSKNVLNGINLIIPKSSKVGFIGSTGCGKSTLLDIIMGLLEPTSGSLTIDGVELSSENCRSWQRRVAHVPQSIYLCDGTIEENIAFGVNVIDIDRKRIIDVLRMVELEDFVESLPQKYNTFVGERGVRLSGGQRQRIGIARALYKNADIVVLDEATSALDNETEKDIMNNIYSIDVGITFIIVAHRLNTLEKCQNIVLIKDGLVYKSGSFEEVVLNNKDF